MQKKMSRLSKKSLLGIFILSTLFSGMLGCKCSCYDTPPALTENKTFNDLVKLIEKNASGRILGKNKKFYYINNQFNITNDSGNIMTVAYTQSKYDMETNKYIDNEKIEYRVNLDQLSESTLGRTPKIYGYFCVVVSENEDKALQVIDADQFFKNKLIIPFNSRPVALKVEKLFVKLYTYLNNKPKLPETDKEVTS